MNQAHPLDSAQVGDGATYTIHTDSHAGTIIARTEKSITWQRDKATLLNGVGSGEEDALQFSPGGFVGHTSGRQRYAYERDAEGTVKRFTRRANGRWVLSGCRTKAPGMTLSAGRYEHYDYNF